MSETPAPLADLELVAGEIFERWDTDMRSGKLLTALSGLMAPGYDPRVDRIRQALAARPVSHGGGLGSSAQEADTQPATADSAGHTPGPWEYVPGNEHHGPYICSDFGSTIADCYVMSRESIFSGEPARAIPFLAEMAEPNARLIAAAPDGLEAAIATDAVLKAHNFDPEDSPRAELLAFIAKATGASA
jgi:hypothetical protein